MPTLVEVSWQQKKLWDWQIGFFLKEDFEKYIPYIHDTLRFIQNKMETSHKFVTVWHFLDKFKNLNCSLTVGRHHDITVSLKKDEWSNFCFKIYQMFTFQQTALTNSLTSSSFLSRSKKLRTASNLNWKRCLLNPEKLLLIFLYI